MDRDQGYRIQWEGGDLLYFPGRRMIWDLLKKESIALLGHFKNFPVEKAAASATIQEFFRPVCLTFFLGTKCNLNCTYCYVPEKKQTQPWKMDPAMIRKSAEWVSGNCVARKMSFILGFHGGNEPLLYKREIQKVISICQEISKGRGLPCRVFCTTNGVIPEKTAHWAANTFSGITVSWDGPAAFHDFHRKQLNGKPTEDRVRRTVEIIQKELPEGSVLKIRATITDHSVNHLEALVEYFGQYGVRHVEMMPVYPDTSGLIPHSTIPDKEAFVFNFLKARTLASKIGMKLNFAGSRLDEPHDKFCTVFQDNFTITPDGFISACFLAQNGTDPHHQPFVFGHIPSSGEAVHLDWEKLSTFVQLVSEPFEECKTCFNQLHCSKTCPEKCPVLDSKSPGKPLDCRVEKWIGLANILDSAGYCINNRELEQGRSFFQAIKATPVPLEVS